MIVLSPLPPLQTDQTSSLVSATSPAKSLKFSPTTLGDSFRIYLKGQIERSKGLILYRHISSLGNAQMNKCIPPDFFPLVFRVSCQQFAPTLAKVSPLDGRGLTLS